MFEFQSLFGNTLGFCKKILLSNIKVETVLRGGMYLEAREKILLAAPPHLFTSSSRHHPRAIAHEGYDPRCC